MALRLKVPAEDVSTTQTEQTGNTSTSSTNPLRHKTQLNQMSEDAVLIQESDFRQMRCRASELTYGQFWVQCVYIIIAIIFIPIGIITNNVSNNVKMQEFSPYSKENECSIDKFKQNASWGRECTVSYKIKENMDAPIYFYYKINHMYVNHRSYVMSRNDEQLSGNEETTTDCTPVIKYDGEIILPCGAIAYSFFNDKYKVKLINGNDGTVTQLCDNDEQCNKDEHNMPWSDASWHSEPNWSKKDIAWKSDINERFKETNVKDNKITRKGKLQIWQNVTLPNTTDEDLIVWMRTATSSEFLKLHRINNEIDFKKGDMLNITIHNYFEVNSFDGTKSIVISTNSALGGKNSALGIGFITVGAISLATGVFFCVFFHANSEYPYE